MKQSEPLTSEQLALPVGAPTCRSGRARRTSSARGCSGCVTCSRSAARRGRGSPGWEDDLARARRY